MSEVRVKTEHLFELINFLTSSFRFFVPLRIYGYGLSQENQKSHAKKYQSATKGYPVWTL